jgi:uncharacterized DUF497 family protein
MSETQLIIVMFFIVNSMQNVPISARKTKTKEEQAFNLGEFD